jgi:hypothetical protein
LASGSPTAFCEIARYVLIAGLIQEQSTPYFQIHENQDQIRVVFPVLIVRIADLKDGVGIEQTASAQ